MCGAILLVSDATFVLVNLPRDLSPFETRLWTFCEMCRKRLCASSLVFLSLVCVLASTRAHVTENYDDDEDVYSEEVSSLEYSQKKRSQDRADLDRSWMVVNKREPAFTPYISVGALSNMQQFFEKLKGNLDSLEKLPQEERAALIGKPEQTAESETRAFRPPATAAYLHAIRNQRPSYKIRNFVANAEPLTLRGSNYYDPSYLWSGLGRRR